MIYVDYPTSGFIPQNGKYVTFRILGDKRLNCRIMIVKTGTKKLPEFTVRNGVTGEIKGKRVKNGNMVYNSSGDQDISIKW